MSIIFGDKLEHNNPIFPIADIADIKGGTRTIATFSNTDLYNAFNGIPDKLKQNYSNIIVTSTNQNYYLSGTNSTITTSWTLIGSGLSASGTTNSLAKWTGSTSLGDSLITDNGDTITINGNLTVIGTSSTISSQNLFVKDPIILLAGSQSTPQFDSGLFVNRGTGDTQAFIWDESDTEFKFISTTSSATTLGNVSIGTYSNVRTGSLSIGTGTASNSRFVVSSTGGTNSLIVNEQGDTIFSGDTEIIGQTFSNLPPGSITFGGKTSIYSPGDRQIIIGTDRLSTYNYHYGWKFTDYQITNLWGNIVEFQNTIGTIGNLFVGAGNALWYSQGQVPSTVFIKGTTSSIMKVVGTGATSSNSETIFGINDSGCVSIGTSNATASLHIKGTSSVFGSVGDTNNSLLIENSSGIQLFKVVNNGQIILGDNNYAGTGPGNVQGVFIVGQGTANYGANTSNPNLLTFIVGSVNTTFVSGIQGASLNHGNVRSGIYFTNNASDIVFRTGYNDEYGVLTSQLQERMRIGISGNVSINAPTAMSDTKLFIQSSTSSSTIGNNVMLNLHNHQQSPPGGGQVSELAFSATVTNDGNSYNTQHRYAIISGYATTWNNVVTGGGIKFSTRATTGSSLVTALVVSPNGSVYNDARGTNTLYGLNALLVSTGINNVAIGANSMQNNLVGVNNTAVGLQSLGSNTSGNYNTAVGCQALVSNVLGSDNTAIGISSQHLATQSSGNTSIGRGSLYNNLSGGSVAIGLYALTSNTIGIQNTAVGTNTLTSNTTTVTSLIITDPGSGYTQSSTFSNVQLSYMSGSTAMTYPIVTVYVGTGGTVSTITLVTNGSGFKNTSTIMGANLGTGVTFSVSIVQITSGDNNTALGYNSLLTNTSGYFNTGIGAQTLYSNITGVANTALGMQSLSSNTTGNQNTAVGYQSSGTTTGSNNTSLGYQSLYYNRIGSNNIAIGYRSLWTATQSSNNTAIGYLSLYSNTGSNNTALGVNSMYTNTTGTYNTSLGINSLYNNTTGSSNTILGVNSLYFNTIGSNNVAFGYNAGYYTATNSGATNSNSSVFIGYDTRPQADDQTNQIVIGYGATGSGSNSVTLGASTITKTQLRGIINLGNVPVGPSGLSSGDVYQTVGNVLMVVP